MSDLMILDIKPALSLHQQMTAAAGELDFDAQALAEPLTEAADLLGRPLPDMAGETRKVAANLHDNAEDLHTRIQMVLAGGHEMNAGLAALERIRASFTLIESRGKPDRSDGKLGLGDLEWARRQLDGKISDAAGWLADHKDFFTRVETAKDNNTYINRPYDSEFAHNPEDADGVMRIADIDAFVAKTAAWATLLPHAKTIDTAHRGGKPDGILSRKDFEAFLLDYDVAPGVAAAVRRVLADGAQHRPRSPISLKAALDVLSFVPAIGDVVDGARSIYYALHRDWQAAGLYALGIVPLPGLSGSGVTAARTVARNTVRAFQKSGYRQAASETGKVMAKGTSYNWTANAAAEAFSDRRACASTKEWLAQQIGVDITKIGEFDDRLRESTGEDIGSLKNRLSDATGHNLGVMDGFFSDSCEVIARRLGEHKLSKMWLKAAG